MSSHARVFDQENLMEVSRMDFNFRFDRYYSHHCYMDLGYKDISYYRDATGTCYKAGDKVIAVSHYVPKDGGGLSVVHKIDKEIFEHMKTKKFIN
jgi:hypothetical protein